MKHFISGLKVGLILMVSVWVVIGALTGIGAVLGTVLQAYGPLVMTVVMSLIGAAIFAAANAISGGKLV